MGLGIGCAIAWYQINSETSIVLKQSAKQSASGAIANMGIGGGFSLVDHTGKAVSDADYADKYKLIYFGFTYCPAICPTELQKMAQVEQKLDEARNSKIQQIFITVDPERDTVDVMKDYVSLFDSNLIGLTGTPQQVEDIKKKYRVFSSKVQTPEMHDYTVDHSSYIYLVSPDSKVVSMYRIADDANYIAADIAKVIALEG